jgi:hypothetical protein
MISGNGSLGRVEFIEQKPEEKCAVSYRGLRVGERIVV